MVYGFSLHIVFVHILEEGIVGSPAAHTVLKELHCFDAGHIGQELAHNPDTVGDGRGVEEIVAACA